MTQFREKWKKTFSHLLEQVVISGFLVLSWNVFVSRFFSDALHFCFLWVITLKLTVERVPLILQVSRSTLNSTPVWATYKLEYTIRKIVYESGPNLQLLLFLLQTFSRKMRKTHFSHLVTTRSKIHKTFFLKKVYLGIVNNFDLLCHCVGMSQSREIGKNTIFTSVLAPGN